MQQNAYSAGCQDKYSCSQKYPSLLYWPRHGYFDTLKRDTDLLGDALSPLAVCNANSLSDQVFGNQLKQQGIGLKHQGNLFYERCKMHNQHIQDIDDRHLKVQGKLFGVEINNFPDRNKRMGNLEGQLLMLENQRREEELAFWRDTVELRQNMFETAASYKDARNRYSIFSDVEGKYA